MKFEELSDEEWELIEPLLPPPAPTGCKWMDMPGEYGSYVTAWRRFRR
ncbi:MAG: hypothetical protein ACXQTW_00315 [Candidatus Methanospirareceae archaeon]